jgi:predicted nucleotidyltransferase
VTDSAPTRLFGALQRTATVLQKFHRPFALVGGLAVSIRVDPRFTRDIDLAVAVADDAEAEQLVAALVARGFALRLSLEQRAIGRLATVRLSPPGEPTEGVVIDLLFASTGIEDEICAAADRMEVADGVVVPVATAGHLLVMKLLSRSADRPQDEIDVRGLLGVLTADDRRRATEGARQIERLGANRGKLLVIDLAALLSSTAQ